LKIYTRGGDTGETGLFGGDRIGKGHERIEALGAVDELNAALGWANAQLSKDRSHERLERVQHDLFAIGAHLAAPTEKNTASDSNLLLGRVEVLERWIDELDEGLPELRAFVIPGGVPAAAGLHLARTVCRRAERVLARLSQSCKVDDQILAYVNRLSDLLFMLARQENQSAGTGDIEWIKP
tara:strand:+ start:663 stop:1208 length:546 start_codon:yes stop_codon:yes gene_type:complete